MHCQQVQQLLPQYAEGVIPLTVYRALRKHLESCVRCRELHALYGHELLPSTAPPPEQLAEYMQHLEARLQLGLAHPETRRFARVSHEVAPPPWRRVSVLLVGATTGWFLFIATERDEGEQAESAKSGGRRWEERINMAAPLPVPLRLSYMPSPSPLMTEAAPSWVYLSGTPEPFLPTSYAPQSTPLHGAFPSTAFSGTTADLPAGLYPSMSDAP